MGEFYPSNAIGNNPVAAIFPTKKARYNAKEVLKRTIFGIIGKNAKVKIEVYQDVDANNIDRLSFFNNNLEKGRPIHSEEFEVGSNSGNDGAYTFDFKERIKLNPNLYFSIVVTLMSDCKVAFSEESDSTNDLTFYKSNEKWVNTTTIRHIEVATIKALTKQEDITDTTKPNEIGYATISTNNTQLKYNGTDLTNYSANLTMKFDNTELTKDIHYSIEKKLYINDKVQKYNSNNSLVWTLKFTVTR